MATRNAALSDTRRDPSHVNPAMRPTKYDYDRYLKLVQIGRSVNWDQARLRDINPFRVADPTMTFTLLRANRDLAAMGRRFGEGVSDIGTWIATLEAGAETLWSPEIGGYDGFAAYYNPHDGTPAGGDAFTWTAAVWLGWAGPEPESRQGAA